MKHTLIFSLILVILLCAGCGAPAATETMKQTRPAPPTQTAEPTPAATPEPEEKLSHYIGYVREPEAYVELSEYLRQFMFGISGETEPNEKFVFEAMPSHLTYRLSRANAHQKPIERGFFQICAVKIEPYNPDKPLPGTERSIKRPL